MNTGAPGFGLPLRTGAGILQRTGSGYKKRVGPDSLNDREWAMRVNELKWIREQEEKAYK